MNEYKEEVLTKLKEIYKSIMQRIMQGEGKIEESDVLFLYLYQTEFKNAKIKE